MRHDGGRTRLLRSLWMHHLWLPGEKVVTAAAPGLLREFSAAGEIFKDVLVAA